MVVGVPREIKDGENRVAITPAGVRALREHGHRVLVERHAGWGSSISDEAYREAGAHIVAQAAETWRRADMMLKVKEPLPSEYRYLRPGLVLFTYLHLAAARSLMEALLEKQVTAVGYETVQTEEGALPLLVPMSEIAGRLAVQVGAHYLQAINGGGRGILLGGVPGVPPAEVVIVGCGVVGMNAAKIASGAGAHVTILDIDHERLRYIDDVMHGNVITVFSSAYSLERAVSYADLLIGAVLTPGARAPKVVTTEMVKKMKQGAVVVDVAVDQGGCIATTRPTSHSEPTFQRWGVVHYCVTNMPAAVPRTATHALTNVTIPYVLKLADLGFAEAAQADKALARGVNTYASKVVHPAVAEAFRVRNGDLEKMLEVKAKVNAPKAHKSARGG